ncbi:MAG: tRNA (cytidine(56)-2'-O)-methyltransferase [Candidatus Baldrarchaeia archaeon]
MRDSRITTHVGLVARAFGADEFYFSGDYDDKVISSINDVVERWGGPFKVGYVSNWRSWLKEKVDQGWDIVHLTMYGIPVDVCIEQIRGAQKNLVIVVGGTKVPREVYDIAQWNVSITLQPHSEVAALAVFLHEFFMGKELKREFEGAKIKIIPCERGKRVVRVT